jgi:Na+-driven multidrug efflux pump
LLTFKIPKLVQVVRSWKQVLYIGLPAAGTLIVVPVAASIVIRLVAAFGHEAVAAFGVANRIEMFAMLVIMALGTTLSPFVGQNLGAKKYDRAELSIKYSQRFALGWGLAMTVLLALLGKPIASLFSDNPEVISTAARYFWIVPISYGLYGVIRVISMVLNVLHRPLDAALLTLGQAFFLYIPLAYIGSEFLNLEGIFGAAAISFVLVGIAAYLWLRHLLPKLMRES